MTEEAAMNLEGPSLEPGELAELRARIDTLEARLAAIERAAVVRPAVPRSATPPDSAAAQALRLRPPGMPPERMVMPAPPPAPRSAPTMATGVPPWVAAPGPAGRPRSTTMWGPGVTTPAAAPAASRPAEPAHGRAVPEGWAPVPATPRPSLSLRDLEERFAGRALAWTGGLALIAAAIFFLSLAFSRGWITEPLRVLIGIVAGAGAFGLGAVFLVRRDALLGHVLTAVGLGVTSITLMAGTRLYDLFPPEVGLLGALIAAIAAATLAVRTNAVVIAAYGLVAALLAPPMVGASPTLLTLGFVAVTLVGTTGVALFRAWRWLPPLAFILAAPQLASWLLGDPEPSQALIALAGFWLVNIVAAAGEEVRIRRDDLRPSSATLVLANATFLIWGGFVVLAGDLEPWRGTFIGLAAAAHLLVGMWFLDRQDLEHLFGNLVAGTGVACLTLAVFVQLGAPAVPVAWAAEAVALGWLAARRLHRWSAAAAVILGCLAVSHLLLVEYPLRDFGIRPLALFPTAFQHPETASLGAVLLAVAVAIALVPVRWVRSGLAGIGVVVAAYAMTFELAGPALEAALVALVITGLLLDRFIARLPTAAHLGPVEGWVDFAWFASLGAFMAGLASACAIVFVEYPIKTFGTLFPTPFQHPAAVSLAIALAGLLVAGALLPVRWVRSALAGAGLLLVAYALPFELTGTSLIAALVVLLPVGILVDRGLSLLPDAPGFGALAELSTYRQSASTAGALVWAGAALHALDAFLPPWRWGLETPPAIPFNDERALVGALLAGSALVAARWLVPMAARRVAVMAALAVAGVVIPFEVYADGVSVLWVGLAGAAMLAARWDRGGTPAHTGLAGLFVAGAALVAFGIVARPDRLWVVDEAAGRSAMLAGWPLAFVAVGLALYAAARIDRLAAWRTWLELAAGATGVYLASIAIVDVFQRMVGGTVAAEELAKQGQVALSVLWTVLGAIGLAAGVIRLHPMLRHAGLGLIGLATAKVFVIDLAAMDVAYRAVVLAALGLLLLISAFLFTRFRGPRAGPTGITGGVAGNA